MYVFKQHEDLLTELQNGSWLRNFSTPRTSVGDIAVSNFAGTQLRYHYLRAISNAFGRDLRTLLCSVCMLAKNAAAILALISAQSEPIRTVWPSVLPSFIHSSLRAKLEVGATAFHCVLLHFNH